MQTDGSTFYVFVDGSVEAFHANGAVMWHTRLPFSSQVDMQNTSLAAVFNGIIYVMGGNGAIYALRVADGTLLWHYQATSGTLFGLFSIQGNILSVGILPVSALNMHAVRSSFLLALRTSDGRLLWQRQLAEQELLNPTSEQGVVYIVYGTGNGREVLSAFRATNGLLLWTRSLSPSS